MKYNLNDTIKLKDKFLLAIVSIIVLVLMVFSVTIYEFEKKQIISNALFDGEFLTKNLSYSFTQAIKSDNTLAEVKKILTLVQNNKNIDKLVIKNGQGAYIYPPQENVLIDKSEFEYFFSGLENKTIVRPDKILFSLPIYDNDILMGTLYLDYSLAPDYRKISYFKYFLIISTFIGLVLSVGLAIILSRLVTRQVDMILATINNVSEGNFSHKIPRISDDELGNLANAFNQLFLNLKESHKESYNKTKKIITEKNKLHSILTNLHEGVIVIDNQQKIIEINKYAEEIFDKTSQVVIGEPVSDIIGNREYIDQLNGFTKKDERYYTYNLKMANEVYKICLVKTSRDNEGLDGIISVFINMTQEYEISEMKTNILHTVSHELKTPIISILGFLNLLKAEGKDVMDKNLYEYVTLSYYSAKKLKLLVNNLLGLTRLEANQVAVDYTEFDFIELVKNSLDIFQLQIKEKNLKVNKKLHVKKMVIKNDLNKVSQIITNIIDNSIKFTFKGSIGIATRADNDNIYIEVSDTGIGISAQNLSRIFQKFNQIDAKLSRKYEGLGLGLSIVKELVRLLGGEIKLASEEGKGTTVSISLPLIKE